MTYLMKIMISVFVVVCFLVSGGLLFAQEKITLQLSVWGMPFEDQIYTEYAIPQFEEMYPHIEVEFLRFENYWDILLTRHAAGEAPDVQRNLDQYYGSMRLRGAYLPLTEYIEGPEGVSLDDFHEVAIDALTKDGEIWALPQDLSPRSGVYYNMRMFDEAGMAYPTSDWTIDEMVDIAEKLTIGQRPRIDRYGLAWIAQYTNYWAVYSHGGQIWSDDGSECVMNSEEAVRGIEFLQDLIYEHQVAPSFAEVTPEATEDLFKAERIAMYMGGGWFIPAVTRDVPDLEFGVVAAPYDDYGNRNVVLAQCIWAMSSQTEHPDEAWLLIKHLASPEVLTDYWQRTWVAPPSRLSMIADPKIYENIIGIPGHVPAITDPEEVERKLGWMRDIILDGEFTTAHVHDFTRELGPGHLWDALDELYGVRRGDAQSIMDRVVSLVHRDMEDFYK